MERAGQLRRNTSKAALPTSLDRVLTQQQELPNIMKIFQVWKSEANGWVYDPEGICPCLCVGNHSGDEPKIIEYEE